MAVARAVSEGCWHSFAQRRQRLGAAQVGHSGNRSHPHVDVQIVEPARQYLPGLRRLLHGKGGQNRCPHRRVGVIAKFQRRVRKAGPLRPAPGEQRGPTNFGSRAGESLRKRRIIRLDPAPRQLEEQLGVQPRHVSGLRRSAEPPEFVAQFHECFDGRRIVEVAERFRGGIAQRQPQVDIGDCRGEPFDRRCVPRPGQQDRRVARDNRIAVCHCAVQLGAMIAAGGRPGLERVVLPEIAGRTGLTGRQHAGLHPAVVGQRLGQIGLRAVGFGGVAGCGAGVRFGGRIGWLFAEAKSPGQMATGGGQHCSQHSQPAAAGAKPSSIHAFSSEFQLVAATAVRRRDFLLVSPASARYPRRL